MFKFVHMLHILIQLHIVQKFATLTHMAGDFNGLNLLNNSS